MRRLTIRSSRPLPACGLQRRLTSNVSPQKKVRAGSLADLNAASGDWAFVDVGFAREGKTGGLLVNAGSPQLLTFSELRRELSTLAAIPGRQLNLVVEAPLSAGFTGAGNPAGRSMERQGKEHRYWYAGLGCQVTLAAAYLLRPMHDNGSGREVCLYEAFVSFKRKGSKSSHSNDVLAMRSVAWGEPGHQGRIIAPEELAGPHVHIVQSAFKVFGFDCGVPPVIVAGG